MSKFPQILLTIIVGFFSACNSDDDVYEELDKLRGLGVQIDPVIAKPSSVVTLTLYAAVPTDHTISSEIFTDQPSLTTPAIENLEFVTDSESYQDFSSIRIYSIKASFTVPTAELLRLDKRSGTVNLQYGIKLTSGSEEEKVVGKVDVLDPESEDGKKTWENPDFSISKPSSKRGINKDSEIEIAADINNKNDEDVKIGWFVSGGTIKNRRARQTKWKTGGSDAQVLIGTIRGKRSHSFALTFREYKAE